MALIGPATSSFSTASIVQSAVTTTASHLVKKSTGKTITEHAIAAVHDRQVLTHGYLPKRKVTNIILPKAKPNIE
tara:strand:+ start:28 stop:252 length:225 start_codon:yes stop_codon:yes gene_type:complete